MNDLTSNQAPWFITLFRAVIAACIFVCLILTCVVSTNEREFLLAILGTLALVVVSLPLFLWRDFNLFEPLTLVILLVLFGTPFRIIYALGTHATDPHVASHVLFNQEPEILLVGMLIVITGLILFVVGYMMNLPTSPVAPLFLPHINEWNGRKLQLVFLIIGAVSLICFLGFILVAGVNVSDLSEKRFGDSRAEGSNRIMSSKYYLYRGAALSKFVVYFGLVWLYHKKKPLVSWTGAMIVCFLIQTIMLSYILDSRSGVILMLVDCMILYFFLKKTISFRLVGVCVAIAALLTISMLATRGSSDKELPLNEVVKKTLTGRNMLDIAKTCHIINGVPKKMEHRNGEMLYAWMAAPIPKSILPNKPNWPNQGVYLNQHIFGYKGDLSGCPPGLIGELYWDFGKWGVWIGLLIMGLVFRQIFLGFRMHQDNPTCILIYTMIISRFVMYSLGNDFGTGVVKAGLDLVPVYMIIFFIGMRREPMRAMPSEAPQTSESTQNMLEMV
jgi:hypothetical protein